MSIHFVAPFLDADMRDHLENKATLIATLHQNTTATADLNAQKRHARDIFADFPARINFTSMPPTLIIGWSSVHISIAMAGPSTAGYGLVSSQ